MKTFLRSGARVCHETLHLARPQAPTPKEKQSRTIPTTSTNQTPQKTAVSVRPHCKEGLQIFLSTHCQLFLLDLTSDQHQNPPESQLRKTSNDPKTPSPNEAEAQIAQNPIPLAKLQAPTPIKLLFDFSLICTVLRKAPFLSLALPKRIRKMPGPESAKDKGAKPLILTAPGLTNC